MSDTKPARTYNQNHIPRRYTPGRRRVSIYLCWSFPAEANRHPDDLDNRFSTMNEIRRVEWPRWEAPQWSDPLQFQQGIAGGLELFFRSWTPFQDFVGELTGHVVPVFQRIDQAGFKLPLDERALADADTLLVFGLDHAVTGQVAAQEEIEAVRQFLNREGTCLVLGPHHDVGAQVNPTGSFADPEYAQVGLTEAKARETRDVVVAVARFDSTTRTIIDGRTTGFCKLIADRATYKILGCHVVGERAVEITQVAAIAIGAGMRVDDLAQVPLSFPTYAGILGRVAASAARQLNLKVTWQGGQAETDLWQENSSFRAH